MSQEGNQLNVVVLEYDGRSPGPPRPVMLEELMDVANRSNLDFVIDILKNEKISKLMCYSTFHIDCAPWHQKSAVILGDAAHAYGPLTAKMANLAINDSHTLATLLNNTTHHQDSRLEDILERWEATQRPKFAATRIRTLRHLQLYSPQMRALTRFLWRFCTQFMLRYFGSIFAYDYSVVHQDEPKQRQQKGGVVGARTADPLQPYLMNFYLLVVALVSFCSIGCMASMVTPQY